MSRISRYAFIHAKLCGVMARTLAGEGYRDLLRLKTLGELSDRLFPQDPSAQKGAPLPIEVEARIMQASVGAMTTVLDFLRDPPALLVHAARRIEYQTVQSLARALMHGGTDEIRVWDLGKWSGFRNPDAADPEKTLRHSVYSWVLPLTATVTAAEVESRIDRDYFDRMLDLCDSLPAADRMPVRRLMRAEIALRNAIRVLRLRFFFKMDAQKSRSLMIPGASAAVRTALEEGFDLPADSAEEWRRWRFAGLLEDQLDESFQAPDPVRAELPRPRHALVLSHGQEQVELLLEQLVVVVQVVPEQGKRFDERSPARHDLRSSAGQQVQRGEVLVHAHGIIRAEHRDRAGQPDALRAGGAGSQHHRRSGADEIGPVVLPHAVDVQPELVRKLYLFHDLPHAVRGTDPFAGLDVRRQVRE